MKIDEISLQCSYGYFARCSNEISCLISMIVSAWLVERVISLVTLAFITVTKYRASLRDTSQNILSTFFVWNETKVTIHNKTKLFKWLFKEERIIKVINIKDYLHLYIYCYWTIENLYKNKRRWTRWCKWFIDVSHFPLSITLFETDIYFLGNLWYNCAIVQIYFHLFTKTYSWKQYIPLFFDNY